MKIAFFDTHNFERQTFDHANSNHHHPINYIDPILTELTAVLAKDHECVSALTNTPH